MQSASKIIEEWLCKVLRTYREKGPEATKDIPIPQDALRIRSVFVRTMEESVKDLEAIAQFVEEHADDSESKAVHLSSLRTEARELQTSIDQIVNEDPFAPNWEGAPGHVSWHPTGYAGIVYARNTLLAECHRWITPRWPAAAEQLRESLARLTTAAERVDAPLADSEEKACKDAEIGEEPVPQERVEGGKEICKVLKVPYDCGNGWRKIKRYSDNYGGPIRHRGNKPYAVRSELLFWWEEIDKAAEQHKQRRVDKTVAKEVISKSKRPDRAAEDVDLSLNARVAKKRRQR